MSKFTKRQLCEQSGGQWVFLNRRFVCTNSEEYKKYKLRETGIYIPEPEDKQ